MSTEYGSYANRAIQFLRRRLSILLILNLEMGGKYKGSNFPSVSGAAISELVDQTELIL